MIKSIGTKLALKISIALILVMTLFGVWDIFQRREQLRTLLDDKQERVKQQLVLLLGELLYNFSEEQIENAFRSYLADPDILSIKILVDESVLEYLGVNPETQEILNFADPESKTPHYEYAEEHQRPIVYLEEELGSVEVVFSQRFITDQVEDIILNVSTNILLVIIIETIVVLTLARRDISIPLLEVAQAARRIAKGDLSIQIRSKISQDEIGTLSRSFTSMTTYLQMMANIAKNISKGELRDEVKPRSNNDVLGQAFHDMSTYLNEMASVATAIAEGDLRQEVHPRTEHDVLGNAFQQLGSLRTIISDIMSGAERLNDASAVLQQISTDMASGTEESSQQLQGVSSKTQQISHTINGVSTATEELAENIREISRTITDVVTVIGSTVAVTQRAHDAITQLHANSKEIGAISQVITTITQQTNLLALNATIEAARAGDFGKGFAVVAGEVKALARETATSAEDITHKIEAIQLGIEGSTQAMTTVSAGIQQIKELSDAIASAVEEQTATTHEISRNIADTAHGSEEISRSIVEVASATQQASEQTATVQEAAQELDLLAQQLRQLVEKFKI